MLTLYAQYYVPKNEARQAEIDACFRNNIANPLVTSFIIYFEKESDMDLIQDDKKITKILYEKRLTYGFWLLETNKLSTGSLSILINSDIYLTKSVKHLVNNKHLILSKKKFIALTRYNPDQNNNKFILNANPHWTQDTWAIVKGEENFSSALIQEASFELGQPGCDNKIVAVMHGYRYTVTNPCAIIQTIHLQADEARSYDGKANKLLGLHGFAYATSSVQQNSKLEFDFLSRNLCPFDEVKLNNWINDEKSYTLKPTEDLKVLDKYKIEIEEFTPSFEPIEIEENVIVLQAAGYEYIHNTSFDIDQYNLAHSFDWHFSIYEKNGYWFFYDKFWPYVRKIKSDPSLLDKNNKNALAKLFCMGFIPGILELEGKVIGETKKYQSDVMFWQMPAKTEKDAWERHVTKGTSIFSDFVDVYIGLPWATMIDQIKFNLRAERNPLPKTLLTILTRRIKNARDVLSGLGMQLRVHTVCQQIYWTDLMDEFLSLGITDLWLTHKTKEIENLRGLRIHAWPLFAVNIETEKRRVGIEDHPIRGRKYFASFIGAYMEHYGNDTRPRMVEALKKYPDYFLKLNDMWHFNEEVYNQQLGLEVKEFSNASKFSVNEYNVILSNSKFSLCPVGAGPNTLRLWESLALGTIPVVISDQYDFPVIKKEDGSYVNWLDAVIVHAENDLDSLDDRLRSITQEQLEQMSQACKDFYRLAKGLTCFGLNKNIPTSLQNESLQIKSKSSAQIKISIPYHGENDRYFWRQSQHGIYDLILDWHAKGLCEVEHHDGPYYWVNGINQILLFDRDQVADLHDKKKHQPRWKGEVSYKYAFFTNEYNLKNDRNFEFNYWSFKPIELENYTLQNEVIPYANRTIASIFLGSVENESQEYFRNKFKDWGAFIEEYYVADKLNLKEKAKYSFSQYLVKISQSKFGICFRGNGPKCYREIEYASVGTPMIVTEGVDVNYPNPLIEGVHFLTASNASDIEKIIQTTTEAQWKKMSAACRDWYLKNFTSQAQFKYLNEKLLKFDLSLKKPTTVYIEGNNEKLIAITQKSCLIFNPDVRFLDASKRGIAEVKLIEGDIIINELPYNNTKNLYSYKLSLKDLELIKSELLDSALLKHKKLACLLRWRLPNFKIKLTKNNVLLKNEDFISDHHQLVINEPDINYEIEIDYDLTRALSNKYLERKIAGQGVFIFPKISILSANMHYICEDKAFNADITYSYQEYVALYDQFIPENLIWRKLKLWEFENCQFKSIDIKYAEANEVKTFAHHKVEWHPA
jgi:hypothetical protein